MSARSTFAFALGFELILGCSRTTAGEHASSEAGVESMTLTIQSSAFAAQAAIPRKYTCEGDDVSPPLSFGGVPPKTQSLALIVDDPDAPDPANPKRTWVHWVVYNLPSDTRALGEGAKLPTGAREGKNDWDQVGYRGPCPPVGRHRYFHKLYALDVVLPEIGGKKADLERAMAGHILAKGELVGTYQKGG